MACCEWDVVYDPHHQPWLRLLLVPELRKVHWFRLQQTLGSPDAVLGATAARIAELAQVSEETARAILRGPETDVLDAEERALETSGADLYTFEDERYPENLRRSSAPPMLFYVLGELRPDDRHAVVVVGSRMMTHYGKLACQKLVGHLVGAGVTIISGMAYGIDAVAHETAIRHGGRTLAVLGQGLAARESAQRLELRRQIAEHGAVISEFPMMAVAERFHFPTRNHTMAALGLGTVVVEAGEKSGALITAERALDENRQVFAVPGDINRQTSAGTNNLIRAGATLVRDGQDVLDELASQLRALLRESPAADPEHLPPAAEARLDPLAAAILDRVRREPTHLDILHEELAATGVGFGALSEALLELEMKGLVRHLPGNLYTTGSAQ